MKRFHTLLTAVLLCMAAAIPAAAQPAMTNVYGRDCQLLNGKWAAIIDPYDQGVPKEIFLNRTPQNDTEFFEYAFEGGLRLEVPGDWNSQSPELKYYEGTVWYARHLMVGAGAAQPAEGVCATTVEAPRDGERMFLYFGAVNYRCNVYLNGKKICTHEGGFTPFEVEIGGLLRDGDNFLAVEVDNRRRPDAIPAMTFDWWNYGGITRDVMIVRTPKTFIRDYFLRLDNESDSRLLLSVDLSEPVAGEVSLQIPELGIDRTLRTDAQGHGETSIDVKKLKLWSPEAPYLYDVRLAYGGSPLDDRIGFRRITVDGTKILVNGRETFMRSISFHEEIPQRRGRAFSEADAAMLLSEAKALGCNMIRLAHYPQNEYIVRMAERMGFMLWEEIPVWQGIDFGNDRTRLKAGNMIREMVMRDKNRCALTFWGVANETQPSEARNAFLRYLIACCREIDDTRLITAAFDLVRFDREKQAFVMNDPFIRELDVVAVNKYMGWYHQWPVTPDKAVWEVAKGQPLIVSEFGGEALYGVTGNADVVSSWSEDYQATLYRDNLEMFRHIPNLRGTSPWILFDFRSPFRFHPTNQQDWNRKGLISDQGYRKKAWYLMKAYYESK